MSRLSLGLGAIVLAGCSRPPPFEGMFDVPQAATVLEQGAGGPFTEPVAYASSTDGGQIAMLDLRKGIYLADQPTASFIRGSPLPTGRDRVISGLAAYAPDAEHIDVWAADRAFGQVLRVPHIVGLDDGGAPLRVQPTATTPVFVDVDDNNDGARATGIITRVGYTSTEDWVFDFDGTEWHAHGSRSGRQEHPALPNVPWASDKRALELTLSGGASAGDRIEMSTDSGIEEFDLGGIPLALAISPDQRWLAVSVTDPDLGQSWLRVVDPATGDVVADAALPLDAEPGRLVWTPDSGTLYVTDFNRAAVWGVAFDVAGPGAVTEHTLPWTVFDVAALRQPDGSDLLYVAPVAGREVWIYDTATASLVDFNPVQDGVNGLDFDTPVQGLEALPMTYEWPESDGDGVPMWGRSVAVSLYNGTVQFMREGSGCLIGDLLGPRTDIADGNTNHDYTATFPSDGVGAYLEGNATNDRHVIVNRCGGVARRELWSLTYRRDVQAWQVEGNRSGEQTRLAYEDQRYVSDTGAVSFTIRGGTSPSEDGWRMTFTILPGVVTGSGDVDGDGTRDVEFDLPGDPVFFHHETVEQREDGWLEVRDSPFVLVPATSGDLLGRIDPRTGELQVTWW